MYVFPALSLSTHQSIHSVHILSKIFWIFFSSDISSIEEKNDFVSFVLIKKCACCHAYWNTFCSVILNFHKWFPYFTHILDSLTYFSCKLPLHFIDFLEHFWGCPSYCFIKYKKSPYENNKMPVILSFKILSYFKLNFKGIWQCLKTYKLV